MVKMAFSGMQETPESKKSSTVSGPNPTISLTPTATFEIWIFIASNYESQTQRQNFLQRSHSFQLVIRGKGKFGHLNGSILPPATDSSYKFDGIKNWRNLSLLSRCYEYLGCCYFGILWSWRLFSSVWTAKLETRGWAWSPNIVLPSRNFGLKWICSLFTNGKIQTMTGCWLRTGVIFSPDSIEHWMRFRGRILGLKTLPSIDEVFAEVQRDESRKRVLLHTLRSTKNTALVTHIPVCCPNSYMKNG